MADFLSYYHGVRRRLEVTPGMTRINRDLQDMIKKKQPNCDLIDYVYELLEHHNLIPDAAVMKEKKSDAKAKEFRHQGNALYITQTKNVDAIIAYNKSICYAESKENLSIGLANRSAVFFQMQMYPECVDSIRLAREAGIPERLKEKLDRREEECQEKMKTLKSVTEEVFVPKIELPVNEKIPFLAKCLSTGGKHTFSKYVVADEDIPAGTIIALEEPICKVLMDSEIYLRCANCLAEVPHLLLPCSTCTQTMFCSKECEKKAFDDFHAIECPISGSMMKIFPMEGNIRLSIRLVIYAFVAFQGDTEKMEEALEKIEREKKNVFDFDWSQELSPEDIYTSYHTLWTNENISKDTLFMEYVASCLILNLLQRHSPIFIERFLSSPKAIKILKNLIFRHILIISVNASSLNLTEDATEPGNQMQFGCTITHSCCLLKPSCLPNVTPFTYKTCNGLITLKKITAGEQLTSSSQSHHRMKPKIIRQKHLFEKFNIKCKCVACTEDYPMAEDMEYPCDLEDLDLDQNSLAEQYSYDYCMNGYTMSKDYLREFGHLYPIFQIAYAEEALKFCLLFLCGNTPLRMKEKVRQSTM